MTALRVFSLKIVEVDTERNGAKHSAAFAQSVGSNSRHAVLLKQSADGVATSREGRRSPRSGREGQHRRWDRERDYGA